MVVLNNSAMTFKFIIAYPIPLIELYLHHYIHLSPGLLFISYFETRKSISYGNLRKQINTYFINCPLLPPPPSNLVISIEPGDDDIDQIGVEVE